MRRQEKSAITYQGKHWALKSSISTVIPIEFPKYTGSDDSRLQPFFYVPQILLETGPTVLRGVRTPNHEEHHQSLMLRAWFYTMKIRNLSRTGF